MTTPLGELLPLRPPLQVQLLRAGAQVPTYATDGSAGLDLYAPERVVLWPGRRTAIPLGIALAIPYGYEGQIRGRSGLARDRSIYCAHLGTVDADYRGEISALLVCHGWWPSVIRPGDRIAQLVVSPACRLRMDVIGWLPPTVRGVGGWGSTGR